MHNVQHDGPQDEAHWLLLDTHRQQAEAEAEAIRLLIRRFDTALDQLGKVDCQLSSALGALCANPQLDSYDSLNCHVAQQVEPGIRRAMTLLANEVNKARTVVGEVLLDTTSA